MNYTFFNQKRVFGLDVLRALAIFFVLVLHGGKFIPKKILHYYSWFFFDGVGIFFVLSGFLIGGIFIKQMSTHTISWKSIKYFWLKRWTRTLPNYYLFLVVMMLIEVFNQKEKIGWGVFLQYFTFTQNFSTKIASDFFQWSWSLSVEEWFYILLPLAVLFFTKFCSLRNAILSCILSVILLTSILRYNYLFTVKQADIENLRYTVIYRLDGIMYGVLGAYIMNFRAKIWNQKKTMLVISIILFGASIIAKQFIRSYSYQIFEFSLTSITVLLSLPYLSALKTSTSIWVKPISILSIISYSLYLINMPVQTLLNNLANYFIYCQIPLSILFPAMYISFWIMSIGLSVVVYILYERPVTNWFRKKFDL